MFTPIGYFPSYSAPSPCPLSTSLPYPSGHLYSFTVTLCRGQSAPGSSLSLGKLLHSFSSLTLLRPSVLHLSDPFPLIIAGYEDAR